MLTRRRFLARGAGAVAGAALALYATRIEPRWVQVVRRRMPVPGLPAALAGRTLVQLSDLHVGPRVDERYVVSVLELARGLAPDLVAFTGDFVTYHDPRQLEQLSRVLRHAPRGRLATLGILGNHDYGPGWSDAGVAAEAERRAREAGIAIMRNEVMDVRGLTVVGFDDLWAHRFDPAPVLARLPRDRAALYLCHNPDCVDRMGWTDERGWTLAGHTHGGQVKLPLLPPPLLPVSNRRYAAGAVDLGRDRWLYVNRGIGHLIPVRIGVRPEVTVFSFEQA